MSAATADRDARRLIKITGNPPRRYVPGSLAMQGEVMTWTERCKSGCRHERGECHMARSCLAPREEFDQ